MIKKSKGLRIYYVLWMKINSEDLGEPVSRPRYYFVLLRSDACIFKDMAAITSFCAKCLGAAASPVTEHIEKRMLPNDHPEVAAFWQAEAQKRRGRLGSKWQERHQNFQQQVPGFRGAPQSSIPLASVRQQELWRLLHQRAGSKDIIADVSQGIDRQHARIDGVCPTITPRGVICVGVRNRPLVAIEKLVLHGFPMHRVSIPSSVSNEALGKMGGNTMHVQCVGLALLMGISLLRDPLPAYRPAERPSMAEKPQFVTPSIPAKQGVPQAPGIHKRVKLM